MSRKVPRMFWDKYMTLGLGAGKPIQAAKIGEWRRYSFYHWSAASDVVVLY